MATTTIKKETPANIGAVKKTGDTMTGVLTVQSTAINLMDTTKGNLSVFMHIGANGTLGLYSNGYYNGSSFVSDGKWLVYRDTDGITRLGNTVQIANGGTGATGISGSPNELTAGQNIVIGNSSVKKWGEFGVLTLAFEVTAQINAYANIFTVTSAYKASGEYNGCVSELSGKCYPVYYNSEGILRTRVAMPAGHYYGNLSFCVL